MGHPIPGERRSLRQPSCNLEDELQSILNAALPIIDVGGTDCSETANARARQGIAAGAKGGPAHIGCADNRAREERLVGSIKSFKPQLDLHAFPQLDVFLNCQINVLEVVPADVGKPEWKCAQVTDRRRIGTGGIQNRSEGSGIEPSIGARWLDGIAI